MTEHFKVPVGHGFVLRCARSVTVDEPDLPVIVHLELALGDEGRLVITKFVAEQRPDGPPVTIDVLKSMPLVGTIERGVRDAGGGAFFNLLHVEPQGAGVKVRPVASAFKELTPVEQTAVVYRAAYAIGRPPTSTVAEELDLSKDVAAKHVQAARLSGLLEPAKGRRGR